MASIAAKESITGTIVTYIGVGIGFLTTFFILAKFLTPEEIGLTRLLPELATQLSGLGMLGMTYSLSRYFPFFRDSETNPYRPEDGTHRYLDDRDHIEGHRIDSSRRKSSSVEEGDHKEIHTT